ncbi:Transmembrane protein 130-like, partial [Scleropages formosus]
LKDARRCRLPALLPQLLLRFLPLLLPLLLPLPAPAAPQVSTNSSCPKCLRPDKVSGRLVFRQTVDNVTYEGSRGQLASDIPAEAVFELLDPQRRFRSATFMYTWDLGNGEAVSGAESYVTCNYSSSGNYILKLEVGVTWDSHTYLTRTYSVDLKVLDAIKGIEFNSPSRYYVAENTSLSFFVGGRMEHNCYSSSPASCHMVELYKNTFSLNYTFTSEGRYCLNLSFRNNISVAQTSYSIFVTRDYGSNLYFILPCAALILATLVFIGVMVCRPVRPPVRTEVEVANFCFCPHVNLEMKDPDSRSALRFPPPSSLRKSESQPLLRSQGASSPTCVSEL